MRQGLETPRRIVGAANAESKFSRIEPSYDNQSRHMPIWAIYFPLAASGKVNGISMENTVSDQSNVQPTHGYLLLRDGHAIPLHGISPDHIKTGAKDCVPNPEADLLRHRRRLNAIVDRLGFAGDFGNFVHQGWPEFERFLKHHECTHRAGLFPSDHGGCIDLYFSAHGGPTRRQLADRIFSDLAARPKRIFLGYGVDWHAWDSGNGRDAPVAAIALASTDAATAARNANDLFSQRTALMGQWGFLDDKLVAGPVRTLVDKSYWPHGSSIAERERNVAQLASAVKAFRQVFDAQLPGWVDVHRFNERLVVLRGYDGGWDVLWRDYREDQPPRRGHENGIPGIDVADIPARLMSKEERRRMIYLRQDTWAEKEEHEAEQAFYDRGGSMAERRLVSSAEVLYDWLCDQEKLPAPGYMGGEQALPPGFSIVTLGGRTLAVSAMISVGEFRSMLAASGYGERRNAHDESWERANDGVAEALPVGASWVDAQAFCAWKERQTGAMLRLPTIKELRALRPIFSSHYERLVEMDFPWEHFPPRPMAAPDGAGQARDVPSAVAWSEPRFAEAGEGVPAFPADSGVSTTSRKRWIVDFPPHAGWSGALPLEKHHGLDFIDAWDAYEWCQEQGWVSGRFWEGPIGASSWGAYKNVKTTFRLVMDLA